PSSLRRLPECKPDECIESRLLPELILRRIDGGAGFGRLEAEVGERAERVRRGAGARSGRSTSQPGDAELALQLIGDARGELGADPVGAADHRLIALADGASELVGGEDRKD